MKKKSKREKERLLKVERPSGGGEEKKTELTSRQERWILHYVRTSRKLVWIDCDMQNVYKVSQTH
jgi:hypothetical protein